MAWLMVNTTKEGRRRRFWYFCFSKAMQVFATSIIHPLLFTAMVHFLSLLIPYPFATRAYIAISERAIGK
jgi:hypothetical protein